MIMIIVTIVAIIVVNIIMIVLMITRQTNIHIHRSVSTVFTSTQVYCVLSIWCIWINIGCG